MYTTASVMLLYRDVRLHQKKRKHKSSGGGSKTVKEEEVVIGATDLLGSIIV
jgi:hypothetical protein